MGNMRGVAILSRRDDPQEAEAVDRCENECEIYGREAVYIWDGKRLCPDCFKAAVASWLEKAPGEVADALGVDVVPAGQK